MRYQFNVIFPDDYKPHTVESHETEEYQILKGFLTGDYKTMCIDYSEDFELIDNGRGREIIPEEINRQVNKFRSCIKTHKFPIKVCSRGLIVYFKKEK